MGTGQGKISFLQICMIMILMQGLLMHVILNPFLLDASGRDAWISVLFTTVPFLFWCVLLVIIMKKSKQQKLQPWLAEKTSPAISWIMMAPLIVKLYSIGIITLYHTSSWTITNYIPSAPRPFLCLVLLLVCCYCASQGIRTIGIVAGALLPIVLILGYFVALANSTNKDYSLLRPLMEHGFQPVLNGMIYAGGGYIELLVILVVQHRLKAKIQLWKILLLGLFLMYLTLGTIIGAITEFGPIEAAKQYESPYEQWRLVKLSNYIEHVDFLSVFQWLAGATIRISFSIYLITECFTFKNAKIRKWVIAIIGVSQLLLTMVKIDQVTIYEWLYNYYFLISLPIMLFLSFLWLGIALLSKKSKETST